MLGRDPQSGYLGVRSSGRTPFSWRAACFSCICLYAPRRAAPWIVVCLCLTLFCTYLIRTLSHQIDETDAERHEASARLAAQRAEFQASDKVHFDLFVEYVRANEELMKENKTLGAEALKHPAREYRDF